MRNRLLPGVLFLGLQATALALPNLSVLNTPAPSGGAEIRSISLKPYSDRWEIQVNSSRPVSFSGRQILEGHRFFVDFNDSWLLTGQPTLSLTEEGVSVRAAQFSVDPPIVRVVVQSSDATFASLSTASPASQAILVVPGASHTPRPTTRIQFSTFTPTRRDLPPSRLASRPRTRLASRGGRVSRPHPDEVFHPDALEEFDEPPVPSEGGSLQPVMAAGLPDPMMEGVRVALAGNRRYVWGGESPQGFDCSGMQQFIYRYAGVRLPRTAAEQYGTGTPVEFSQLEPGDLVFFSNGKRIFHVGMYIGNGKIFHAANPHRGLTTDSLSEPFYAKRFAGARRYLRG